MSWFAGTDVDSAPLVSCIMPTYGRPSFIPESLKMFLDQDYPKKELIILNDCPKQEFVCESPNVRIVNQDQKYASLGEKRNALIKLAKGALIAIWDDDDIYLPWRISYSVQEMMTRKTAFYRPSEYWAYWGSEQLQTNRTEQGWISHPLTIFSKELWESVGGYDHITLGEDAELFERFKVSLGCALPRYELPIIDRFFILRGTSKYAHTSIEGGRSPADTTPGTIHLKPTSVQDHILATSQERLVRWRETIGSAPNDGCRNDDTHSPCLDRLDALPFESESLGYGELGLFGELGYEGKKVQIGGKPHHHAISAHGPSVIRLNLSGEYETFHSRVALNDDVVLAETSADFIVLADNKVIGLAQNVVPGELNRSITADVTGRNELQLVVRAHRWDCCHSVWVDPVFSKADSNHFRFETDCLEQVGLTSSPIHFEHSVCIATVGSPGFEDSIDDLLGSICAFGQCTDMGFVIFFVGNSESIEHVAKKYNASLIYCTARVPLGPAVKSILYSAARFVPAEKFICFDADMLVLADLRPIVSAIDCAPYGAIHVCREACWARDLSHAMETIYSGSLAEMARLCANATDSIGQYPLVVNDGLFAGTRAALCSMDELIRGMSYAPQWIDEAVGCTWRNQFVFNLALARLRSGRELGPEFNVQLNCQAAEFDDASGTLSAKTDGLPVRIIHFNGSGREKHSLWKGRFSQLQALNHANCGKKDRYSEFVDAIRVWLGHGGTSRLAWSFYGTADGTSASIRDTVSFPLYATLFSLIRSNGCCKVVESGTARGISAACMAAAVVDQASPAVVTFDPESTADREALWQQLPTDTRKCIIPKKQDAIVGMREAVANGERFHAALLDSIHSCDHVLKEFELATALVCCGGLILIHDPLLKYGTVGDAIEVIADRGYRVVKLWSADEGSREDDHLGLAVVENRIYQ